MQRGERLRVASRREWEGVDGDRGRGEYQCQSDAPNPVEPTLPCEVAGQEREHEEADVGKVERTGIKEPVSRPYLRIAEQLGQFDGRGCGRGQSDHDGALAQRAPAWLAVRVLGHHELFPQPLGVLARKLARDSVEVAQPLDGD